MIKGYSESLLKPNIFFVYESLYLALAISGWNISRGTPAKIEAQVKRVTDSEVVFITEVLQVDLSVLYKKSE